MLNNFTTRKTSILKFLFPSLLLTAIALITFTSDREVPKREKYENFLRREYKKVPCAVEERSPGLEEMTGADLAEYQNFLMTIDPALGYVPKKRLIRVHQLTEQLLQTKKSDLAAGALEWQNIPANMGGRTRAIMWDPNDPGGHKVWAGGVTGGLWYIDDITSNSSHWIPVDDFWNDLSIACISYDPNYPQIFYAGTGEAQTAITTYRESSGLGVGIFKSTDGGNTWSLLESSQDFDFITDIKVRDEGGNSVVYAGIVSGVYHGIHQSSPSDGLYRSTDGGLSWEQVLPNITGEDDPYPPSSITIQSDGRIYVGTMPNLDGKGGAVILYSDEGTAGTWTVFEDYRTIIENDPTYYLPGRVILASAAQDENMVYALIAAGYIQGNPVYYGRYIIKTINKGATWTPITKPNSGNWANLAWHALTGTVDPNNSNRLYVGGLDVWNTNNAGSSWYHVSDWSLMYSGGGDEYVHADQHAQVYKPGSSDECVFTSDGGVFYTAEATSNSPVFQEKNRNYNTLQFYSCDLSPLPGMAQYIGGLQDNGTLYYNDSPLTINNMVDGGDGAYCFYDKDQPAYFITSLYYNQYTVFYNGNAINSIDVNQSGIFINPADYDYRLNTLYANAVSFSGTNANKILRITNVLQNPSDTYITLATGSSAFFSHIKYSPYSPLGTATLFVGTNAGRLYRVDNAQATPVNTEIGSPDFPPANISCVAIGGSEDTLLVTFSNYGVPSVWQTYDGGLTWQMKEGNLPDMPVRWTIYHPQNSKQVLLATEIGVWSTNTLDQDEVVWEPDVQGMANVRTDMLKIRQDDNTVLAATHGRGLFTAEYPLNPNTSVVENNTGAIRVYPNPSAGKFFIDIESINRPQDIRIIDINGKQVWGEHFSGQNTHLQSPVDMSGCAKGVYFLIIKQGKQSVGRKLVIY
jgi:hypothetical protein